MKKGFSLIELLVVISIFGVVFAAGSSNFRDFSRRQEVRRIADGVLSDLRLAHNSILNGKRPTGCNGALLYYAFGVIPPNYYSVYAVCATGPGTFIAKQTVLPNGITISAPGQNPIIFNPLARGTNIVSSPTTMTISGFGTSININVTRSGEIY